MNKSFRVISKSAIYFTILIVLSIILFRVVVGSLWGSHSDIGLIAAPFVAVFGVVGIFWTSMKMTKDLQKEIEKDIE